LLALRALIRNLTIATLFAGLDLSDRIGTIMYMAKYVYVDNSNIWIEGRRVSAVENDLAYDIADAINNKILDFNWKYDCGKLLKLVGGEKDGLKKAYLFGSRPPQNDSLWEAARVGGFEVVVEDRNADNIEKKIDTGIVTQMMADSYECIADKSVDEMILVAGDKDYVPAVNNISKRGIRVVVYFWNHAAIELKNHAAEFISLNKYICVFSR
jgi:uncharacterized LabA/DUF88 family protein